MAATMDRDVREAGRRALDGLRQAGYLVVGAGDATAEAVSKAFGSVRDAARDAARDTARELPDRMKAWSEQAPKAVETGVERLTERGRRRTERAAERLNHRVRFQRVPIEERTVDELQRIAADRGIEGRSGMNKEQLLEALRAS